jgi:hypothetical protein
MHTKAFKLIRHKKRAMQKDHLQHIEHSYHTKGIREFHKTINNVKEFRPNVIMIRNADIKIISGKQVPDR